MNNLFSSLPTNLPQELTEVLAENKHVRIERIVSHGHVSPDGFWYDLVPSLTAVIARICPISQLTMNFSVKVSVKS